MKFKQQLLASATLVMKVTLIQLLLCIVCIGTLYATEANTQRSLEQRITLSVRNQSLNQVINRITQQTNANFSFSTSTITTDRLFTFSVKDKTLRDFLEHDLSKYNINYKPVGEQIVLFANNTISTKTDKLVNALAAQAEIVITGTIYDNTGQPLPGVLVSEKGATNATSTNIDGVFTIRVKSANSVLVIRSIGFDIKEIPVGSQTSLKITLTASIRNLEDVIVVGYGTQKKVTSVGSQSSIGTKELVQSPVANISNSLVGRLPGIFAVQPSGEPGNDQSRLFIRGVGTFSGSQGPLVLVDGIQVDNFNSIDPNDIENLTILKDASSTAVYGIRGANGVILITTKRGKKGAPTLSYTFNNAFNSFTDVRERMNSFDYANSFNQARLNDTYVDRGVYSPYKTAAELELYKSGAYPVFYPNVDWYDLMLKKVSQQRQHNLQIRGGTEKVKYLVSAGLFNQEGLFNTDAVASEFDPQIRYKRYTFRSNIDYNISKRFKAALDVSTQIEDRSGNNANTNSLMNTLSATNPLEAPGVNDGRILIFPGFSNPFTSLYGAGYKSDFRNLLNGSVRLDHDLDFITKGLTTHGLVAFQTSNRRLNRYGKPLVTYRTIREPDNSITYLQQSDDQPFSYNPDDPNPNRRITAELALDYNRKFGSHTVTGLLLYNQIKTLNPSFAFVVPNGYQSYVGRAVYDFKGKYLAEFSAAYNGTENFAPSQRFGYFPAYSLGWVPTEEKFFPKNSVVSFIKFRGSYGEVGNDQLNNDFLTDVNSRFLYRSTAFTDRGPYSTAGYYFFGTVNGNYQSYPGIREGRASSPFLTWERALKTNLGMDLVGLNDKLSITVDLFKENRDNILAVPNNVSGLVGVSLAAENLGKMSNKGFEFDATYRDKINEFNYWVRGNYSFAKNTVEFKDEIKREFPYRFETGNIFGQYFGLIDEGLYNTWEEVNDPNRPATTFFAGNRVQPGDVKYRDVNGDGKIDINDEVPIGYSNIPQIIYAMSFGGNWKGLDFSVLFQGADNFSVQYSRRSNQAFHDTSPAPAANYLTESWTQERYDQGLPIKFPRFGVGNGEKGTHNYQSSTFWLANAQYLRLKNVEIGYNFKGELLSKVGLKSTRVYVNGNNLVTWSNMLQGVDPESPNLGTNFEPYGLVRTFNLGLNLNF